jgi:sulfite reductase (NADPH) flavoprotein alpha-component
MNLIHILWGSQTGNAQNLAHVIGDSLSGEFCVEVHDMGNIDPEQIHEISHLIIVTSTYGDGEPPDNASEWMSFLKFSEDLDLSRLNYAVIGLGDTYYPHFCQAGKDFDEFLGKHGAHSLLRRVDFDLYYEELYSDWLIELKTVLQNQFQV